LIWRESLYMKKGKAWLADGRAFSFYQNDTIWNPRRNSAPRSRT
jgi:hypothetical protein